MKLLNLLTLLIIKTTVIIVSVFLSKQNKKELIIK